MNNKIKFTKGEIIKNNTKVYHLVLATFDDNQYDYIENGIIIKENLVIKYTRMFVT